MAIKAWSRIVMIMMKDYKSSDDKLNILDTIKYLTVKDNNSKETKQDKRFKTAEEINNYIDNTKRNSNWYRSTDEKLFTIIESFIQITNYNHSLIRLELLEMCSLLISNCSKLVVFIKMLIKTDYLTLYF